MFVPINPSAEVPIYRQIVHQVRDGVASGAIPPGQKLPSHRDLAVQLVVAPLTVKKAYDELERQGLVETRRGRGSFICERPLAPPPEEYRAQLAQTARRLLTEARLAGAPLEEVLELIRALAREENS